MTAKPTESQLLRAARPAAMARELLGGALGQLQEVRAAPPDLQEVTAYIAKAVGALYAVQASLPEEPAHVQGVRAAMQHLSPCLAKLQDVKLRDPAIDAATASIARTLALLYPVSKTQEKGPLVSVRPQPLPHDPRRSTQRYGYDVEIGFQSETNFYTGLSQDLSEGGMFVATYDTMPIGTKMSLSFTLPDGHVVSCVGAVRWTREYNDATPGTTPGMGIQFTELSNEDRRAIETFMAQRPAMLFEA